MPLSTDLAQKSVQAAVAAIEVYNKPNFLYREEAFALLMTNAWELLLKGKWLLCPRQNPVTDRPFLPDLNRSSRT